MSAALKWRLGVGFLLVFLAGASIGWLVGNAQRRPFHLGSARSGALAQRMSERLRTELRLTPEQSAKIAPIIEQSAGKLETIRVETARRVRQTLKEAHLQISPDLTPEQRSKLAAMEEKHHRRHGRHRNFQEESRPPLEPSPNP